jgi:hypothetical protein
MNKHAYKTPCKGGSEGVPSLFGGKRKVSMSAVKLNVTLSPVKLSTSFSRKRNDFGGVSVFTVTQNFLFFSFRT